MDETAHRQANRAAIANAAVNAGLTVLKAVVGTMAGSRALVADAVHSGADVVGSIAVMVGLQVAKRPPDSDHPYGHGKAEILSSSLVALILFGASVEIAYTSIRALFAPAHPPEIAAAYAAAASIAVKEVMYQWNYRIGRKMHSQSLMASAYDHRSDVYASVAALIGIVLALCGRHFQIHWLMYMDDAAGAVVAVLVMRIGFRIASEATNVLMDRTVAGTDLLAYEDCVHNVFGVLRVDEVRVRDHGQYVIVDAKIGVDALLTVAAGHEIAEQVKLDLIDQFDRVQDVLVHVNPHFADEHQGEGQ